VQRVNGSGLLKNVQKSYSQFGDSFWNKDVPPLWGKYKLEDPKLSEIIKQLSSQAKESISPQYQLPDVALDEKWFVGIERACQVFSKPPLVEEA
jgi:hypothetical protein